MSADEKIPMAPNLKDCEEAANIETDFLNKIGSVLEEFRSTVSEETKLVDTLRNFLNDDEELKSLKGEMNTSYLDQGCCPPAKRLRSAERAARVFNISDMVKFYRTKMATFDDLVSALKQRREAVAKDLSSGKKIAAAKHKELTDFARLNCSSEAQRLPQEILKMIFSKLSLQDLITAGQICQRWRYISRLDMNLWSCREMKWPLISGLHPASRVLKSAPCLGMIRLTDALIPCLRKSNCKLIGIQTDRMREPKALLTVLKKNAETLKTLISYTLNPTLGEAICTLRLTELQIELQHSIGKDFSLSMATLEKLTLAGPLPSFATSSLISSCSSSLKELDLFSKDSRCFWDNEESRRIVNALLQCCTLRVLKMPLCFTRFNIESPIFKAASVTLFANFCTYSHGGPGSPPSSFAPHSIVRLTIYHDAKRTQVESALDFIKRMSHSFLESLESVVLESEYLLESELSKECVCKLSEIPALKNKFSMESKHNFVESTDSDEDVDSDGNPYPSDDDFEVDDDDDSVNECCVV